MTQRREGELTPKQRRFVAEYLVDLNGTAAAKRAGYSRHTARVQASRLLTNAAVSRSIADAYQRQAAKLEISLEWVTQELGRVAKVDLETATRIRAFDKVKALETLLRHWERIQQLGVRGAAASDQSDPTLLSCGELLIWQRLIEKSHGQEPAPFDYRDRRDVEEFCIAILREVHSDTAAYPGDRRQRVTEFNHTLLREVSNDVREP